MNDTIITEPTHWFDVKAYPTEDNYKQGDPVIIDGYLDKQEAIAEANHAEYDQYYQVMVVAYGEHEEYESGEGVYTRFLRDAATKAA